MDVLPDRDLADTLRSAPGPGISFGPGSFPHIGKCAYSAFLTDEYCYSVSLNPLIPTDTTDVGDSDPTIDEARQPYEATYVFAQPTAPTTPDRAKSFA